MTIRSQRSQKIRGAFERFAERPLCAPAPGGKNVQTVPKNLVVDWYDGNIPYRLRYEGGNGASLANFTCNYDVAGVCSDWTVTPGDWTSRVQAGVGECPAGPYNCFAGAVVPQNTKANLYRMSSSLTNQYLVKTVDMPFTLTITLP
jgi:hypothetical protein